MATGHGRRTTPGPAESLPQANRAAAARPLTGRRRGSGHAFGDPQPAAEVTPASPPRSPTANPGAGPASRRPDRAATSAPVMPVPRAVPSESCSDSADDARPCSAPRRLAQDDQRQRRVGEAHPQAGKAHRRDRQPRRDRGDTGRSRTREAHERDRHPDTHEHAPGGNDVELRAWIHDPVVQVRVAAVRLSPAAIAL